MSYGDLVLIEAIVSGNRVRLLSGLGELEAWKVVDGRTSVAGGHPEYQQEGVKYYNGASSCRKGVI